MISYEIDCLPNPIVLATDCSECLGVGYTVGHATRQVQSKTSPGWFEEKPYTYQISCSECLGNGTVVTEAGNTILSFVARFG